MVKTGAMASARIGASATLLVLLGGAGAPNATGAENQRDEADPAADSPDAGPARPNAQPPQSLPGARLRITGIGLLPESVAREAVGPLPNADEDVRHWGEEASARIVDAYRARGYTFARVWFSDTKEPGVLWFDVDEGRMRVAFVGMRSISATLFRLRLNMPGGIFQRRDFERSLEEQRKAFNLVGVSYRVHELEGYDVTVLGQAVPARTLEIHVVRRESFGWALDISVSAAWGVVPSVKYSASDLIWRGDRLFVELVMAFPYRRYIFDAAPRMTWVHGGLVASYRLPHFGSASAEYLGLAPRVDVAAFLSQYARADLQLRSFYLLRDQTVANLVSSWPMVEVSLGFGADLARVLFSDAASGQAGAQAATLPSDVYSARFLARAATRWTSALPWSRRDRRTYAQLVVDLCLPLEIRATLRAQYFVAWGRHRLFVRGRSVALAGNIPFWDDVELAGEYQRVFFGNIYWAHRAAQLELSYRVKMWRDWFEVGLFHDVTAFEDRLSSPSEPRLMNAFGPSLHILILDQYALSIHQGIGFAPGKVSQTLSFSVESVF